MLKEIHEQPEAVSATIAGNLRPDAARHRSRCFMLGAVGDRDLARFGGSSSWPAGPRTTPASSGAGDRGWAASRARSTSPANGDIAILASTSTRWSSASRSRARRPTRSAPCGSPRARGAHAGDHQLAGSQITARSTRCSTRTPASRSASRRRRRSPRSRPCCTSWRCDRPAARGALQRRARHADGRGASAAAEAGRPASRAPHAIEAVAERHHAKPFFLYLGRHAGLPVCLEGALKLKEVAYIPTEAYAAAR